MGVSHSRQRSQGQRLVQQSKLDLADRGSDVKLRELPGDHTGYDYFEHTRHTLLGIVWASTVGAGQPCAP